MFSKKGFSLLELIIVLVIIGIFYAVIISFGSEQKNRAIYSSFIKYTDRLTYEACPAYVNLKNIDIFTTSTITIPYNDLKNSLNMPDSYNGKTPEGNDITIQYKNMNCYVTYEIPKKYVNFYGLVSTSKIQSYNGNNAVVLLYHNINIEPIAKSLLAQKHMMYDRTNVFGTFAQQVNLNIINAYGRNLNRQSDENMNQKDYKDLSYAPNAIPDGQGYAR